MARFAEFVVVAADLSEVLAVEDDGEVVEDLGDESGGRIGISKRQYTLVEKYRMGWSAWFER